MADQIAEANSTEAYGRILGNESALEVIARTVVTHQRLVSRLNRREVKPDLKRLVANTVDRVVKILETGQQPHLPRLGRRARTQKDALLGYAKGMAGRRSSLTLSDDGGRHMPDDDKEGRATQAAFRVGLNDNHLNVVGVTLTHVADRMDGASGGQPSVEGVTPGHASPMRPSGR